MVRTHGPAAGRVRERKSCCRPACPATSALRAPGEEAWRRLHLHARRQRPAPAHLMLNNPQAPLQSHEVACCMPATML